MLSKHSTVEGELSASNFIDNFLSTLHFLAASMDQEVCQNLADIIISIRSRESAVTFLCQPEYEALQLSTKPSNQLKHRLLFENSRHFRLNRLNCT